MQGAPAEVGDGISQAAEDVVQRQEDSAMECHDDGLFSGRQDSPVGRFRAHRGIGCSLPLAPRQDGFGVDAIAAGKGARRHFRYFELGSNARRCPGAAVQNTCHSASLANGSAMNLHHYTPELNI